MHYSDILYLLACFCSLWLIVTVQGEQTVYVWPNCTAAAENGYLISGTNCIEFDQACTQLLEFTADTTLILHPGRHVLHEICLVSDFRNLSLVGEQEAGGDGNVTITCDAESGLAFMNISGLHLQGFTIQNCGLSGSNLNMTVQKLNELVDNFIFIPTTINISVVLVQCEHMSLERIIVTNTIGLGLLGVNIIGNSSLVDVTFTNNTRNSCIDSMEYPFNLNEFVFYQIGGGAYFLYLDSPSSDNMTDHQLVIMDSDFQYNSECSFAALSQINFQYFHEYINYTDFIVGAGGGLSVFMAQLMYFVEVNVYRSTFVRNDARYGGGVYVAFFLGIQQSGVRFINCTFERNGLLSNSLSFAHGGAGMAVFTDILRPNDSRMANELNIGTRNIFVELTYTNFTNNSASIQGGALLMYSQYHTQTIPASISLTNVYVKLTITNCVFYGNTATYGSGAFLRQKIEQGIDGGVGVWMKNTQFTENSKTVSIEREVNRHKDTLTDTPSSNSESSVFAIRSIQLFMSGTITFSDNAVTGCSVQSSMMYITSNTNVNFVGNLGHIGGAIRLQGSIPTIIMSNNTALFFSGNRATKYGGAIYYAPSATSDDLLQPGNFSDCFFLPSPELCPVTVTECEFLLNEANITIEFQNNIAPLGSSIYGATLESCPWTSSLLGLRDERNRTLSLLEFISKCFPRVLTFNDTQDNSSVGSIVLSTPPVDIQVINSRRSEPYKVFPGEIFTFNATIRDSFGHSIPSVLTSHVSNTSANATARLGESGFWFADQKTEWTPLTITGERDQAINVTFLTFDASASTELSFEIRSCPLGFEFNSSNNSCQCDKRLLNNTPIRCDMTSFKLIVPKHMWIGPVSNENVTNDDLVVHRCVRGYCEGGAGIQPSNFDSQCRDKLNRKGFLCGSCETNYSKAFGSKVQCKRCSNYYIFTLVSYAVGGILLFVIIALLGITIDKGWLNMVLFYSNGVYVYSYIRVSYRVQQIFSIPLAVISLKTEIDMCFYNGMTSLEAAALEFSFPAYLFLLMIIFAQIAHRSVWLSNRFSPVSTFVTLAIMSYVSILENCIDILGVTAVTTLDNRQMYRWIIDPTQTYFSGWHICLEIVAFILLIVYIIPFPLVLLFPPIAYRFFGRLKPFLDALYAPFEPKCRCWLGLRLLIRAVIFLLSKFSAPTISFTVTAIILMCLTHIQLAIKPFKNKWQNILDSTLIVDLVIIILMIGALYFDGDFSSEFDKVLGNTGFTILVGGAYVVFVYILILHLRLKYPVLDKPFMWCRQKLQKKPVSVVSPLSMMNSTSVSTHTHNSESAETQSQNASSMVNSGTAMRPADEHERSTTFIEISSATAPSALTHTELYLAKNPVNFTAYRESIVEEF